jgi:hypothetical protein
VKVRLLVARELKLDSPRDEQVRQLTFQGGKIWFVLTRYSVVLVSIVPPSR